MDNELEKRLEIRHRMQLHLTPLQYKKYIDREYDCFNFWGVVLKKVYKECVLCKSDYILHMHHKDHNRDNNKRFNLIIICRDCHDFWHGSVWIQ